MLRCFIRDKRIISVASLTFIIDTASHRVYFYLNSPESRISMQLADKYNIPAPRYTSYPTVPYWAETNPDGNRWLAGLQKAYALTGIREGISLYIHLPYCESLCTYCGCNKRITTNHTVEKSYIRALLAEWAIYTKAIGSKIKIKEIHLGGGTPTFFSPEHLHMLIEGIRSTGYIMPNAEMSFEGHPNNTRHEHLAVLARLGFQRVSYGIQDFDEKVQKAIHRLQPAENVDFVMAQSRLLNYESINFDLVYGLPFQSTQSLSVTIEKTLTYKPERIALYSYAHVPWKSPSQRGYSEADLPLATQKVEMYELARTKLLEAGYYDIGMDHFALPGDSLSRAAQSGTLNRNFMGYTTTNSPILLGLGCSSISDSGEAFVQNEKEVELYKESVMIGRLPLIKGHFLSRKDKDIQQFIKKLICTGSADASNLLYTLPQHNRRNLQDMEADGIVKIDNGMVTMSDSAKSLVRVVCLQFDAYSGQEQALNSVFSKAV